MRSWFVIVAIFLVTTVFALAVMVHMALFRDKNVYFLYARTWSRILLRLAGVRVVAHSTNILDSRQRYVYCANHASLFDIPVILATIPDNVRIMYKRELGSIPIFGWCLRMSPFVAVDRSDARDAMEQIERTVASMQTGASVVVFPEGTRSEDGNLGTFKRGAFSLAARSGRPIVPVSLVGTAAILPAHSNRITPGTVHLYIDPPHTVGSGASRQDQVQTMTDVHAVIRQRIFAHDH